MIFFLTLLTNSGNDENLRQAFEREAVPHMQSLYHYALKLTNDEDDANDLLQETYLRAFRFFDKFQRGTNCKAWLFRIMKNSYINIYRKKKSEPVKLDYEEVETFYESVKPSSTDDAIMDKDAFDNLLDDDIQGALNKLPEEFRTVIILSDIEGFTYEEIADFIDTPIGTVRSRLHRARKMLFAILHDYAQGRGFLSK